MFLRTVFFCFAVLAASHHVGGQSPQAIPLRLIPEAAGDTTALRLLPADPQLKEGNAAVVMLRLIWEQQSFMQNVLPTLSELSELPYDDPRIVDEFQFEQFQSQLKRAAYMRDADWNYPLAEEPLAMILLPDVQGLRAFGGRGMSLWVGQQIAKHDLHAAREGILIQLACSRHLARTPLIVNRLVAIAIADMALDKAELLIQQPQSPNLYWALANLPDALGDDQAALQWEANLLTGSLPSLSDHIPAEGDDAWKQVAAEFAELMALELDKPLSPAEATALKARLLEIAKRELADKQQFTEENFSKMSDEEIVIRWVLATNQRTNDRIENAFSLAPPIALKQLRKIEQSTAEMMESIQAPASFNLANPANLYMALHRFDRRVKLLQTVESIRNHAARNDGALPAALSELELPAPSDPLTQLPFEYSVSGGKATLQMGTIPDIDAANQRLVIYEISVVDQK